MDTTTEVGLSSDKKGTLAWVDREVFLDYQETISDLLDAQPNSYEPLLTKEDVMQRVECGLWQGWLIWDVADNPLALVLFSVQYYGETTTVKIEFLSCKHFFAIASVYGILEQSCRERGIHYIEAIAHPTIAEYAITRAGFSAPGVYIRKPIAVERKH